MGPESAAKMFINEFPSAGRYEAVLYGSLAKTGKGHGTDRVLRETFAPRVLDIKFDMTTTDIPHPNTLDFTAFDKDGNVIGKRRVCSVGGGADRDRGQKRCRAARSLPVQEFRGDKRILQERKYPNPRLG